MLSATLWSTLAQTGGGGIIIPLYFFTHLISSRPALSTRTAGPRINLNDIYLYIPLLLIFHTIPALAMYLTPSLDNRQWWIWFWQMYPCRVSLGYYILTTLRRLFFGKAREEGRRATRSESLLSAEQYHGALGMWLAPLLLASTAAWLYTLFCAPYSLSTIFLPARLSPELEGSFVGLMRRLLQWDQCYVTGAAFFWVAYLMGDLWMAGKVSRGQVLKFVGLVGLVPILGPGAGFLVMWLVRERYLVSGSGEKVSKGN